MNLADQKHPQEKNDRQIINKLLQGKMNDENLAHIKRTNVRLLIDYRTIIVCMLIKMHVFIP